MKLRRIAQIAWFAREIHTTDFQLLRQKLPQSGSIRQAEADAISDPPGSELVCDTIDFMSASAADRLAGASALVWGGEYLFSLAPMIRASFESSLTGMWVLSNKVTGFERVQRVHMIHFNDRARLIASTPDKDFRDRVKRAQKQARRQLTKQYGASSLTFNAGGDALEAIDNVEFASFAEQCAELADRLGHDGKLWKRHYSMLSQLSHPNPATSRMMLTNSRRYEMSPDAVVALFEVAFFAYGQFLRHAAGYSCATAAEGDKLLLEWESLVEDAVPDFFDD